MLEEPTLLEQASRIIIKTNLGVMHMKVAIESNDGETIKSPFLPTKGYVIYNIVESGIVGSEYRESSLKSKKPNSEKGVLSAKTHSLLNDCVAIISRGMDRNNLDINGELNKLAFNISFGHGIHAGIHFRSSTYWSILLGEQVALSVLQDRARSYNEPFTVNITKFDGTTATITNQ